MRRELHAGWLAMSVLLGSTAVAGNVRGEERAKPPSNEVTARDVAVLDFEEGRREHLAGRLEEAELLYLRAWSRLRTYDIAANLGQVQLSLNKPASAARHLAYGVRRVGPEIEPERLARMLALLDEATKQVGTLRVRETNAADAEVFVDGERVPDEEVKHEMYVEPGEHRIVIRRAGYEEVSMPLIARAGVRETVPVAMKPVEAKALEASKVEPAKLSEAPIVAPPAGRAEERAGGRRKAVLIGGTVTAGAAAVAGVVFTVLSNDKATDADALAAELARDGGRSACWSRMTPRCSTLQDLNAESDTFHNLAVGGFVGAGVVGVATLVYGLWPRASTETRVTPVVGASAGGVVMSGRF